MSIVIEGVDIPKSCGSCVYNESSCRCSLTKNSIDRDFEYIERLADCPIKEVDEATNNWIRVSDALPNIDEDVLVCFKWVIDGTVGYKVSRLLNYAATNYKGESVHLWADMGTQYPIAWMPLPELYEREDI